MFFRDRGLLGTAPICLGSAYSANDQARVISDAPSIALPVSGSESWKVEGPSCRNRRPRLLVVNKAEPPKSTYLRENETTACTRE
jgi:hypothetical protein